MEFLYTLDPTAEVPIIAIDRHIGMDSEDGPGIMGDQFVRELMLLDTLKKERIEVWINSGGGVVQDGEQIYHAILKSKTPVDTVNTGTAASIAGPIFLAGRSRKMMDYAKLMMHPVSGGDEKSMKAFEQSIRTMLSSRSFLTEEQIGALMARTSWIFAEDCKTMGLCTEIDFSHGFNTADIPTNASYKEFSRIVNKLKENLKTQNNMLKVTNRLKINSSANEEAILEAIDNLENGYKAQIAENKSKFDKFVDDLASAKKAKEEAEAKYNDLKAKFDKTEADNAAAAKVAAENKAKELIANGVKSGRIANEKELIEEWEKQAVENYERTEKLVNKLPVNKQAAAKMEQAAKKKADGEQEVETSMNSFRAKHLAEYKERVKNRI